MCLILLGIDACPGFPLILAANRDEYYSRPTAPMAFWEHGPPILAGKDLEAGGTWMGIGKDGRFAALTNYRDMAAIKKGAPSRGQIIPDMLGSDLPVPGFLEDLDRGAGAFNGFNLIAGKGRHLYWYSNVDRRVVKLSAGIHGLSNHLMDTPWPKVARGKEKLARCIETDPLNDQAFFDLLLDSCRPGDENLPDTGIGLEWERLLSPLFIQSPTYGTRSATLMRVTDDGKILVTERTFIISPETAAPSQTRPDETGPPRFEERRFTIIPEN